MPASLKDLDALLSIENSCFKSDRVSRRQMRYLLRQGKTLTYVCKVAGKAQGYIMCFIPAHPKPARIYSLAVLPEQRGKGIASHLLKKSLLKLRELGYRSCRLEVRASDKKTRSLYQRFDFKQIESLPGYYEDGRDGIRMALALQARKSK